ncbi:MAG TPA: DnaJ domain-containing protein [Gammaproteobacteria bacterium]|nr:DnaJ domain-containing protein [Gammaproteobacteria bacterium]
MEAAALILIIAISLIAYPYLGHIVMGVIGALFLGILGSMLDETARNIGAFAGFYIGVRSVKAPQKIEQPFNKPHKQERQTASISEDHHIIRCPECEQKIRVTLPLQSEKIKCQKCSTLFKVNVDELGKLKVSKIQYNNSQRTKHSESLDDYFKVLGISPLSSPDEVRRTYKDKIRKNHPDRVAGLSDEIIKTANAESKEINEAYAKLKSNGLAS